MRPTAEAIAAIEPSFPDGAGGESLPLGKILAYSAAAIGLTAMTLVNSLYLFKFSTDVLLIAPGVMGLLYGLSRVWDAISDPIVGYLSDGTNSRFGRRRSWIYASILPTAVAFAMLWGPLRSLGGIGLTIWMGSALFTFSTAQTMFQVPHYALGVELTTRYHERTRVFGIRQFTNGIGLLLGLGAFYLLVRTSEPRSFAPLLAIGIGIGAALFAGIGISRLRERAEYQGRGAVKIWRAFGDVFRNRHARPLLIMYGIESFGTASMGLMVVYVMHYIIKAPQTMTLAILVLYIIPSFALAPIWIRISCRIGKRRLWLISTSASVAFYLALVFLAEGTIMRYCLFSLLLGICSGVGSVIGPSIKADVIDYDELLTGERKEGAYLAVWTFVQKSAAGLTAIVLGFVLQMVGFEPNVEQTQVTKWTILGLYGAVPAACFAVGAFLLLRFQLNEREHAEVRARLEARSAGEPGYP
jgi:GPH family glycoside/pentoside/hexuronide:cation symporter